MDAFFFIDKPTWLTSFKVIHNMRKRLWIKKIGHTGTLDPLATWGLLVATWNYTKLIPYVEKDSKWYRATILLDGESDSYDSDTDIRYISQEKQQKFQQELTLGFINGVFQENFLGKIQQVPPKYSALKIDGKRALDRTLAGEDIVMKTRNAEILSYRILSFSYPILEVEILVSAGTYIRSIAHDLWAILWTWAYLSGLRRTQVGFLDISLACNPEGILESDRLDIQKIFPQRIFLFTDEEVYKRLSDGQRVWGEYDLPENTNIFLFDGNVVRYIVEYKASVLHPRKKVV